MLGTLLDSSFTNPSLSRFQDFQTDPMQTMDKDDRKLSAIFGLKAEMCIANTFPASSKICFASRSPLVASSASFLQRPKK